MRSPACSCRGSWTATRPESSRKSEERRMKKRRRWQPPSAVMATQSGRRQWRWWVKEGRRWPAQGRLLLFGRAAPPPQLLQLARGDHRQSGSVARDSPSSRSDEAKGRGAPCPSPASIPWQPASISLPRGLSLALLLSTPAPGGTETEWVVVVVVEGGWRGEESGSNRVP